MVVVSSTPATSWATSARLLAEGTPFVGQRLGHSWPSCGPGRHIVLVTTKPLSAPTSPATSLETSHGTSPGLFLTEALWIRRQLRRPTLAVDRALEPDQAYYPPPPRVEGPPGVRPGGRGHKPGPSICRAGFGRLGDRDDMRVAAKTPTRVSLMCHCLHLRAFGSPALRILQKVGAEVAIFRLAWSTSRPDPGHRRLQAGIDHTKVRDSCKRGEVPGIAGHHGRRRLDRQGAACDPSVVLPASPVVDRPRGHGGRPERYPLRHHVVKAYATRTVRGPRDKRPERTRRLLAQGHPRDDVGVNQQGAARYFFGTQPLRNSATATRSRSVRGLLA